VELDSGLEGRCGLAVSALRFVRLLPVVCGGFGLGHRPHIPMHRPPMKRSAAQEDRGALEDRGQTRLFVAGFVLRCVEPEIGGGRGRVKGVKGLKKIKKNGLGRSTGSTGSTGSTARM